MLDPGEYEVGQAVRVLYDDGGRVLLDAERYDAGSPAFYASALLVGGLFPSLFGWWWVRRVRRIAGGGGPAFAMQVQVADAPTALVEPAPSVGDALAPRRPRSARGFLPAHGRCAGGDRRGGADGRGQGPRPRRRSGGRPRRTGPAGPGAGCGVERIACRPCRLSTLDPRTPVLVGAGQVTSRPDGLEDALEPIALMAEAVERAAADAKLSGVPAADAVRVVSLLSWRYRRPGPLRRRAARPLAAGDRGDDAGGNSPQMLVNEAALEIQRGELDLAILAGGEAWRTRMRARKAGADARVAQAARGRRRPARVIGHELAMSSPDEMARGIVMPVQVYPMFETAVRAADGRRAVDEHQVAVSELWARFSAVAAGNPYAWSQQARTAEEIRTPGPTNRMIGLPYPKLMNSNNDVDQAAALLMCSVERARVARRPRGPVGVPARRAPTATSTRSSRTAGRWPRPRPSGRGGRTVLELAGLGIDDIEVVDLYSCFPSAVQLGAAALGLGLDRQLTRTGGLSFAGGPWNNYVMHAIATVMADLRDRPGRTGLVWANGGYVTKHSFGVYGTEPAAAGLPPRVAAGRDGRRPGAGLRRAGRRGRTGGRSRPTRSCTTARAGPRPASPRASWPTAAGPGGRRATADAAAALCEGEWVGRSVTLDADGALHV